MQGKVDRAAKLSLPIRSVPVPDQPLRCGNRRLRLSKGQTITVTDTEADDALEQSRPCMNLQIKCIEQPLDDRDWLGSYDPGKPSQVADQDIGIGNHVRAMPGGDLRIPRQSGQ